MEEMIRHCGYDSVRQMAIDNMSKEDLLEIVFSFHVTEIELDEILLEIAVDKYQYEVKE